MKLHAIYGSTYKDLERVYKQLNEKRKYDLCFISHLKEDKKQLQQAKNNLQKDYQEARDRIEELQQRIQEAIEYIKTQVHRNQQFYEMDKDNLLDILGDKENE